MSAWNNHRPVKATRKVRRCSWCNEPIPAGSTAVKHAGEWEGAFYTGYMHPECHAAWDRHPDLSDGYSPGDFKRGRIDSTERSV